MRGPSQGQLGEGKGGSQGLEQHEQRHRVGRCWGSAGSLESRQPQAETESGHWASPSQSWRGELSAGRTRPVHQHLDLAHNGACHGPAHQVATYLASSLIISHPSETLPLKSQPGLPPACSWACCFAPKVQQSAAPYSRNAGRGPPQG